MLVILWLAVIKHMKPLFLNSSCFVSNRTKLLLSIRKNFYHRVTANTGQLNRVCLIYQKKLSTATKPYSVWLKLLSYLTDKKVTHSRLSSVRFRSWSRILAVSLQVAWVINPTVGCRYFPPGLQLPPRPLRRLLPVSLLGEQRHDGCEQFA